MRAVMIFALIVGLAGCKCECPEAAISATTAPERPVVEEVAEPPAPAPVYAARLDLQRAEIGFTKEQIEAAWGSGHRVRCYGDKGDNRRDCMLERHVQGTRGHVSVFRMVLDSEDRLLRLDRHWNNSNFDDQVEAAILKYGQPKSDVSSTVSNRMGAQFDQRHVLWESEQAVLLAVKRRSGDLDECSWTLSKKLPDEEVEEERRKRLEKLAEGL